MDYDRISLAKEAFKNNSYDILPVTEYLLAEISEIQRKNSEYSCYEEAFQDIKANMEIRDAAEILGKCARAKESNLPHSFLQSVQLFRDIEAKIRFSLWPGGIDAPHHFSKLLVSKKVNDILEPTEILAVFAIFANPKGLNLRNTITHGFSFDSTLSLPLLKGISAQILPKLPKYSPPVFNFTRELKLLYFHKFRLGVDFYHEFDDIKANYTFQLLDDSRLKSYQFARELFASGKYVDSLLLLFPILEQSIRRAAVAILDLPPDRLCASPDELFLSVPESLEAFPLSLKNMATDLLFAPEGPRIRDRVMHGAIDDIPKEFAFLVFDLFEKCNHYFNNPNSVPMWGLAFHPARCLEYEINQCCRIPNLDLLKTYNSQTFERLIECVVTLQHIQNLWKDGEIHTIFSGHFQRFICTCVLHFTIREVKSGTLQHLNGLVHSVIKLEQINDISRFKKACETRIKAMKNYLPFLADKSEIISYSMIEKLFLDEHILDIVLDLIQEKIDENE